MKNFLKISKYWPLIICLVAVCFVIWPLFMPGYFSHHDDLQVMRIFEMRRCIVDLQIPCRWVPDMGYGNGYPLFNYYAVLPYYIGAITSFILGYIVSAKLLFAIPLFVGSISMFLLAKKLFGVYPAILASILYTYAPYRALDIYVRGDIAESFALAIIPFCFYFALKIIKEGRVRNFVGLSTSLSLFLISHNIMTVLFMPILIITIIYWILSDKERNRSYKKMLFTSLIIGVGLAAFFILPAFFEKNLVQINNLVRLDLNFRAHFVTLNQLFFSRFWGYGASSPGTDDTISFQIGWPHWWLVILAALVFIFKLRSKRKLTDLFPSLLIGIFLFAVFMTHVKSAFIWERIDILKYTQFPWRFLAITVFASSLLGAYFLANFKDQYKKIIIILIVGLTIFLNWSYFKPDKFYNNLTDQQKLSGKLWDDQQKAAIFDYLPISVTEPREPAPKEPILISGDSKITNFVNRSNRWQFNANVITDSKIEMPIFDFATWKVYVNNKFVQHSHNNYMGRISIDLAKGDYVVKGSFNNTPTRTIANIISLVSLISLLLIVYYERNNKIFK